MRGVVSVTAYDCGVRVCAMAGVALDRRVTTTNTLSTAGASTRGPIWRLLIVWFAGNVEREERSISDFCAARRPVGEKSAYHLGMKIHILRQLVVATLIAASGAVMG